MKPMSHIIMSHICFTSVSHQLTCLGCLCLLPISLYLPYCSLASNLRLGADALASLGLVVDCKRRRLLDSERWRCGPRWPWTVMEIDADWRIKIGTPRKPLESTFWLGQSDMTDEFVKVCSCQVSSCVFFQFDFGGCRSCPACQLARVLVEATACMCPAKCEAVTWSNHFPPFVLAFGV